jgi:hypothetical protein
VRKPRSTKLNSLADIDGAGTTLLSALQKALAPLVKGNFKGVPGKTIELKISSTTDVGFDGILKVGEYGLASDVIDVNDGKKAFSKETFHAEQIPFYVRVHVAKGADQGVLVLQRSGVSGVNSVVKSVFRDYFGKKFPDLRIDIQPMAPDFIMKAYLANGKPRSVTFIKNSIPADKADAVAGKNKELPGKVEVTIKSSDVSFFQPQKLAKNVGKPGGVLNVYTFDEFDPDKIKMKIEVGGKIRTVNMTNPANLRSSFDITDKVGIERSGHPKISDVRKEANDILEDIAPAIGLKL